MTNEKELQYFCNYTNNYSNQITGMNVISQLCDTYTVLYV